MPKKKPIAKRLENLFEDVKPEQTPAELKPASRKRASEKKPAPPAEISPATRSRQPVEVVSQIEGPTSTMSLAFQASHDSWATLQVMDEAEQRQWSQDEQLLVKQVADQLSLALENARLFQETQERAEELGILNQLAQSLSSQLNLDQIVETIYSGITRLINTTNFYVGFYEASTNEIIFPQTISDSEVERQITRLPMGQGITSYMIKTGESILITDGTENWTKQKGIKTVGVPAKSFLGVPLSRGEKTLGAMAVQSFEQYNAYGQHDLQLLTAFAAQVSVALENARLFNEVRTSQGQLSEALQIARLGYFEIDHEKDVVKLTDELYSLLGTSVEKENGYEFPLETIVQRFILDEDIPTVRKTIRDVIAAKDGHELTSEVRYRRADGKVIWVSSVYKAEHDAQGQVVKVVGSSQDVTERKINELIQTAVSQISESALSAQNLDELLGIAHLAISTLLPAKNFYVALYDANTNLLTFPYHVDEVDTDWAPRRLGKGLTAYVIRTGKPLRVTPEIFADLAASGEVMRDGAASVDWLGIPLRSKALTGVIAIQAYDRRIRITEQHQEILSMIASPLTGAIERLLAEEALKRRNDYLAASSEIGRLVTSTLDLNTIFTRTVNLISERFGFYYAAIYIIEESGFNVVLREARGEAGEKMKAQRHSVIVG